MDDPKKVAIVVLVMLAVVFAAALATGAFSGEGSPDPDAPGNDWVKALRRFGPAATIGPADLDIDCRDHNDPYRLRVVVSCVIPVPAGGDGLRFLRFQPDAEVEVESPSPLPDQHTVMVRDTVAAGEETEVAVGAGRAEVVIKCRLEPAQSCPVVLLPR